MLLCVEKPCIYVDILIKTTCTCDCKDQNRVQEEKEIKKPVNRQAETKFTPIRHYQENMPPDPTQKQRNQSNSRTLNADKTPKGNDQELPSMVANSVTEKTSYGLSYHNSQGNQKSIISYMQEKPNF